MPRNMSRFAACFLLVLALEEGVVKHLRTAHSYSYPT